MYTTTTKKEGILRDGHIQREIAKNAKIEVEIYFKNCSYCINLTLCRSWGSIFSKNAVYQVAKKVLSSPWIETNFWAWTTTFSITENARLDGNMDLLRHGNNT